MSVSSCGVQCGAQAFFYLREHLEKTVAVCTRMRSFFMRLSTQFFTPDPSCSFNSQDPVGPSAGRLGEEHGPVPDPAAGGPLRGLQRPLPQGLLPASRLAGHQLRPGKQQQSALWELPHTNRRESKDSESFSGESRSFPVVFRRDGAHSSLYTLAASIEVYY